ncbi:MAG: hypothetical protein SOW59_03050 [Corynebacterium sp.]|nr:hypothetical protein [Corynebacterium sp.]
MQIYAYPGDRIDFVSRSGSAGSLMFGDSRSLVEDFFGPAHTHTPADNETKEVISYFNSSVELGFENKELASVTITPDRSREKISIFVNREIVDLASGESITWQA